MRFTSQITTDLFPLLFGKDSLETRRHWADWCNKGLAQAQKKKSKDHTTT